LRLAVVVVLARLRVLQIQSVTSWSFWSEYPLDKWDNVDGGSDSSGWPCRDQNGWGKDIGTVDTDLTPSYAFANKDQNNVGFGFQDNDNFEAE
jgi:hypothetical protein